MSELQSATASDTPTSFLTVDQVAARLEVSETRLGLRVLMVARTGLTEAPTITKHV